MGDLILRLSSGQTYACPVGPDGKSWWMSRSRAVDNLLHAAAIEPEHVNASRVWLAPVLHASAGQVVDAIATLRGEDVVHHVSYQPHVVLEAQFASMPELACPTARAAGFHDDDTLVSMVERALQAA